MTKDIRELVREARGWQAGHSDDSQRMVWLMNKLSDALEARAGEVERWEKNHEALQDKIDCMKSCGCAYDAAGDICGHHSPKLLAAEAERDRLKAALGGLVEQVAASETWVKHTDAYEIALIELRAAEDGR